MRTDGRTERRGQSQEGAASGAPTRTARPTAKGGAMNHIPTRIARRQPMTYYTCFDSPIQPLLADIRRGGPDGAVHGRAQARAGDRGGLDAGRRGGAVRRGQAAARGVFPRGGGRPSICRSRPSARRSSGGCGRSCGGSHTAKRSPTGNWRGASGRRRRAGRWGWRTGATRSPSSCRATGWSGRAGSWWGTGWDSAQRGARLRGGTRRRARRRC